MPGITYDILSVIKAVVAGLACGLLIWESRLGARGSLRRRRAVALLLAMAAMCLYFQLFQFPYRGYYHRWEMFHYFVGSKYAKELGYERLYVCTAVAEAEAGTRKANEMIDVRIPPAHPPPTLVVDGHDVPAVLDAVSDVERFGEREPLAPIAEHESQSRIPPTRPAPAFAPLTWIVETRLQR